ncbi:lyase [Lithospermum erythrorhizon]|uniref:lactoylglutathione lyase n=1 Tax=Lithospermum erythrorhizon TaxID=34254 RepID=A0AAV3NMR1_LITER
MASLQLPSMSTLKSSSSPLPSSYNSSRRLALIQLGAIIPQSQIFGENFIQLAKADGGATRTPTRVDPSLPTSSSEEETLLDWTKKDERRMLHVVYRVGDLEKTIKFYRECLGMKLLRQRDIPEEKYSNAFLGYGPEESNLAIELTYNYGVDKYDIGSGFGYFGIGVQNVAETVALIKTKGGKVIQDPGLVTGGSSKAALVEDPTGYKFMLLEKMPTPEPLCKMMLRVGDLDRSINFYRKAYGMDLLRRRKYPEDRSEIAVMGYGPEDKTAVLELTYTYGIKEYDKGNGYGQIAIGTDDVYKTASAVKFYGGEIILEPGPLPIINTKITACLDPDGWKSVFVDNVDFQKELA